MSDEVDPVEEEVTDPVVVPPVEEAPEEKVVPNKPAQGPPKYKRQFPKE